jgi:hypothetical protein
MVVSAACCIPDVLSAMCERHAAILYTCAQARVYRPDVELNYGNLSRILIVKRYTRAETYNELVPIASSQGLPDTNMTGRINPGTFGKEPKKLVHLDDYVPDEFELEGNLDELHQRGYIYLEQPTTQNEKNRRNEMPPGTRIYLTGRTATLFPFEQIISKDFSHRPLKDQPHLLQQYRQYYEMTNHIRYPKTTEVKT